ncbi:hypothetical protein LCGC14_1385270 [marine sediment metagenome]|uniref:Uncharacterized protein n=1 Tax=marine sediment metagenome TaxID=412755 RepID=A0A0F9N325_9ZZZZ
MNKGFISTRHSSPSLKSLGSTKRAGANVKGSKLNAKGDMAFRGSRGGNKKMGSGKSSKTGY